MVKMIATSGFVTALERTKFVFDRVGTGAPPRTPLRDLIALSQTP